jgi:hypothetical protein
MSYNLQWREYVHVRRVSFSVVPAIYDFTVVLKLLPKVAHCTLCYIN